MKNRQKNSVGGLTSLDIIIIIIWQSHINVGEEPADSVGKRFAEETGLKFEFAMVWLEQNGVDFEKALVEFNEAKAEGNILPEAYSES